MATKQSRVMEYAPFVQHYSGKLDAAWMKPGLFGTSGVFYARANNKTKKVYLCCFKRPSTTVTAGMLAQRNLFRDASAYAVTQMTDATKRAAAEVRFNKQDRYLYLRTFLMAEFMAGNAVE